MGHDGLNLADYGRQRVDVPVEFGEPSVDPLAELGIPSIDDRSNAGEGGLAAVDLTGCPASRCNRTGRGGSIGLKLG